MDSCNLVRLMQRLKLYIKNEKNICYHNVEEDAVECPVDCVSRDKVVLVLKYEEDAVECPVDCVSRDKVVLVLKYEEDAVE